MACGIDVSTPDALDKPLDLEKPGDIIDVSVDAKAVREVLKALFPELSEEELATFSGKLDLKAVLDLKLEIEGIRALASTLSKELSDLAESSSRERESSLAEQNGGYPLQIRPLGLGAYFDASKREARVDLSGVFQDRTPILLTASEVSVAVDGALQAGTLSCAHAGEPVDIVLLVDITGSMRPVIRAVRDSLLAFVERVTASGVRGTLSVVTFQDTVGVNIGFQEARSKAGYERSPFMAKVPIEDAQAIASLKSFVARLEAGSGADRPENLAAAIDFAHNNVIGLDAQKAANVIDGKGDPASVTAFPALENPRRVFAAITDATFHSDSRTPANSSLLAPFKARPIAAILKSLQLRGTTVHVSDPSWVDESTTPTGAANEVAIDSDFWAIHTGGLGKEEGKRYALNDLDALIRSNDRGLLEIVLDGSIASACTYRFPAAELSATAKVEVTVHRAESRFTATLTPVRL